MTATFALVLAVAAGVLAALTLPPLIRARARSRRLQQPLPEALRNVVARNVPVTQSLPDAMRTRLEGLVVAFLAEKQFVGCNGLEISDEIRATVAALACLLVLGRRDGLYDELQSILVYPSSFWVEDEVQDDAGVVSRRRRELAGEAWDSHRIILSWEDIAASAAESDGYNVVLHEFAHYLEAEGRGLAPDGPGRSLGAWHTELLRQFEALVAAVDRDEDTFLDPYAAEDASEYFAVATEDFIERPAGLRAAAPPTYALLVEFYGIDPASWTRA